MARLVLPVLVVGFLVLTAASPADARSSQVPVAAVRLPHAIEGPSPYLPQTDCDLQLRRGTAALMNLLRRTYPDGTNLGILQSCQAEGVTSEHSDGRALDFGLNVRNPHLRAEAQAFLTWLFATDASGHSQAMARRLGIMYVIYDSKIRAVWDTNWQPYLPSVCRGGAGDDTTCHRSHIHISLSWAGALGQTSFWTGRVAAIDYGPCVPPGHLFAPAYSGFNPRPCPAAPVRPLPQLSVGARGPAVVVLQRVLRIRMDGIFGPKTAAAVVAWKRANRVAHPNSVVDAAMWSQLNAGGALN
ncbi:MAG TPA: hypothetical protein VLL25_05960 [Acidimicrobiales bacterium]|nr:hypothetical protein [Acidimicrobiales bacterium]